MSERTTKAPPQQHLTVTNVAENMANVNLQPTDNLCNKCRGTNHFAKVCKSKQGSRKMDELDCDRNSKNGDELSVGIGGCIYIHQKIVDNSRENLIYCTICQKWTHEQRSIVMPSSLWKQINKPHLKKSKVTLEALS